MQLQTAIAVANSRAVSAVNINIRFPLFQISLRWSIDGKIPILENILKVFFFKGLATPGYCENILPHIIF